MKRLSAILLMLSMTFAVLTVSKALADSAPAAVVVQSLPAPSVNVPEVQSEPVAILKAIDQKIPSSIPASVLGLLIFLIEVLMRFVPTAKPRSLFILLSEGLKIIADMALKVSELLDTVLQKIK